MNAAPSRKVRSLRTLGRIALATALAGSSMAASPPRARRPWRVAPGPVVPPPIPFLQPWAAPLGPYATAAPDAALPRPTDRCLVTVDPGIDPAMVLPAPEIDRAMVVPGRVEGLRLGSLGVGPAR